MVAQVFILTHSQADQYIAFFSVISMFSRAVESIAITLYNIFIRSTQTLNPYLGGVKTATDLFSFAKWEVALSFNNIIIPLIKAAKSGLGGPRKFDTPPYPQPTVLGTVCVSSLWSRNTELLPTRYKQVKSHRAH